MQWKDEYRIGIETIDQQHKKLFELLGFVKESLKKGLITRDTGLAIKELVEYTRYHFASEENLMEKHNYILFEEHKLQHRHLICELRHLLLDLKKGKEITSRDLMDILTRWIVNHILEEDLKLKAICQQTVNAS